MMIGQTLLQYRIEELLGEGGMGIVYRGRDIVLNRPVAIKVLHGPLTKDPIFLERFRNEAITLAQLGHPAIAGLYNFQQADANWLMIMEFVNGQTFEQLIRLGQTKDVAKSLTLLQQALDGLHHAHQQGVLHRDLKPANLMLTLDGRVKLMDFGIALKLGARRLTRTNHLIGTLEYMAPELMAGQEPSVCSDLYAMGVLLYEMLSGELPYHANTESMLIQAILRDKPTPILQYRSDLPRPVVDLLDKALHKKPLKRFQSAIEMREALASVVAHLPVRPPTPATKVQHRSPVKLPAALPSIRRVLTGAVPFQLSMEGFILAGAVLMALIVLYIGLEQDKPRPRIVHKPDSTVSQPVSSATLSANQPLLTTRNEPEKITSQPVFNQPTDAPVVIVDKPAKPVEKSVDKPVTKDTPKKKATPPVAEAPPISEPVTPTPTPTERKNPGETGHSSRTVAVSHQNLLLELKEEIAASSASKGDKVPMEVAKTLQIDGLVVVEKGAPAEGEVTGVRWSAGKRSFLEVTLRRVRAVNGLWLSFNYPPISQSGSSQQPVVFQRGTRIEATLRNTTLTLTL